MSTPPSPIRLRWQQRRARLRRLMAWSGGRHTVALLLVAGALAVTIHSATEPLGEATKLWKGAATDHTAYNIPYRTMPRTALADRFEKADAVYFKLHDVPWTTYEYDLLRLYYATCYTGFPARLRLSDGHPWNANADDLHRQLLDPGPPPLPSEVQAVAQPRLLPDGWVLSFRETDQVTPLYAPSASPPASAPAAPGQAAPSPDRAP